MDENEKKQCPMCAKTKTLADFGSRTVNGKEYIQSLCKACRFNPTPNFKFPTDLLENPK